VKLQIVLAVGIGIASILLAVGDKPHEAQTLLNSAMLVLLLGRDA
jgi:hypothetical protein